jgi:hypothetical protein
VYVYVYITRIPVNRNRGILTSLIYIFSDYIDIYSTINEKRVLHVFNKIFDKNGNVGMNFFDNVISFKKNILYIYISYDSCMDMR